MAKALWTLQCLIFHISSRLMALAQEGQFTYNGFLQAKLHLDGLAQIHLNGLLQLTNTSMQQTGHAFYQMPLKFNMSSSQPDQSFSFSTTFVFAIVPEFTSIGGHGIAFTISPSLNFSKAMGSQYLGLFNSSSNGLLSNHIFAVELDTVKSPEFEDIDSNHVGIDVNSLKSNASVPVAYFSNVEGINKSLDLLSGNPMQVWIDYEELKKELNVTLAPLGTTKPKQPLLSIFIDLSLTLLDSMYVGFSSATGSIASSHYILGWSFSQSGNLQSLDLSKLPSLPHQRKSRVKWNPEIGISIIIISIVAITVTGILYMVRRKEFEEIREDWELEYGPQRFSYKDLCQATKGFKDSEVLGAGGFGKVYRGTLPSENKQVAVKKIRHGSTQGIREFVAEIASMGRVRHRNLVELLGYCRGKEELLLVYEYMPNGSLDKFLFSYEKPKLNWTKRYQILRGIASGLLYLHEEWDQVVLHRDVKASNVLLDADLNGRLGDFGLAKLYEHGENPQTTHVVGTVGYIAPELAKTGKATTKTDVFAFGVFLIEVACGRRPIELQGLPDDMILVDWVFESWKQGNLVETSDPKLKDDYAVGEVELVLKLGLLCSHPDPEVRPSMRQVVQYLDGDSILPETLINGAGFSRIAMHGQASPNSFPSSSGIVSAGPMTSNESILHVGR